MPDNLVTPSFQDQIGRLAPFVTPVTLNRLALLKYEFHNSPPTLSASRILARGMALNRKLREHANTITIALMPALYLAINPSFGQNQAGDIDTWFYFGLAKSFWHQLGT